MAVRTTCLAVALALITACGSAPRAASPRNRTEAISIIADLRRIVTPDGVERLEAVRIGGIDQWISIRGVDRRNPVLLILHGGPGHVAMPMGWYAQRGWEEYFTVVQWDQRGAGKTYLANDPAAVAPTMTLDRMVADTEELVAWLRRELGVDKIVVVGNSWGTYLGVRLAQRHPEWLHAYVAIGQLVDLHESERRGWRFALDAAERDGNREAVAQLRSIAPYAPDGAPIDPAKLAIQRRWLNHYGGAMYGRTGFEVEVGAVALAPEYTDADLAAVWTANEFSEDRLFPHVLALDLDVTTLSCPVVLFNGRHDHNVSATLAAEWLERVEAPSKTLVWFEHSAHEVMVEEPGKVLVSLVQHVLPLTRPAGTLGPP